MVIDPTTLVPVVAYGLLYALLMLRRRRTVGRIDWPRACAYTIGLLAIVVALDSRLDALADGGSMSAHMVQPAWRRALRAANSPVFAVVLYVGAMWLWYVPALYTHVSESPVLHPLGHALFIATGLLFWFHVLRPLPALVTLTPWQKLAYLLAGTLGGAVVAAVLVGAPHALYGASLESQRLAGAVMMGVEMPLAVGAALWVFLRAVPRGALTVTAEREQADGSWLIT